MALDKRLMLGGDDDPRLAQSPALSYRILYRRCLRLLEHPDAKFSKIVPHCQPHPTQKTTHQGLWIGDQEHQSPNQRGSFVEHRIRELEVRRGPSLRARQIEHKEKDTKRRNGTVESWH